jgi:hypothetical protein
MIFHSEVLFGDFAQLPPVGDVSLYQSINDKSHSIIQHTSRLYRNSFNKAFHLTEQVRQQEQDDAA